MKRINYRALLFCSISTISVLAGCTTLNNSSPVFNSKTGTTTTIILTRHGDRDTLSSVLNEKGRARAKALVGALSGYQLTAIYTPNLQRNINTARPTAKHYGLSIKTVAEEPEEDDVVKTILSNESGGMVLWVGNTNNLPQIYYLLGGKGEPPIKYGDLFIMNIKDREFPGVIKKRYGPE